MFPTWFYPAALGVISLLVLVLERLFPARPEQPVLRRHLLDDVIHLVFNGHFLGIIVFGVASGWVLPAIDRAVGGDGLTGLVGRDLAEHWSLWVQIPVALLFIDFLQWSVHYLLHRVPLFWRAHQCHHSVKDGEMDWIVAFRFQWTEILVYRSLLYVPLAWLGFGPIPVMVHAIVGTLIGHLNHANVAWDYGPLRYVLNSPRMHLWHHDYHARGTDCGNFGVIFSMWDWVFGTARLPDHPPERLGFAGDEEFPRTWAKQQLWPLSRRMRGALGTVVAFVAAAGIAGGGWWLANHPLDEVHPRRVAPSAPSAPAAEHAPTSEHAPASERSKPEKDGAIDDP